MERVLEHDLRCENLGFSVMIFSDRGQTSERHTVTRRVSPITSAPSLCPINDAQTLICCELTG
jgi:hypothetical protein